MATDPTAATNAWLAGMQGASTKYVAGVNKVTVAPGQAAARSAALWAQNTAAAQAKFARNVGSVSLSDWQSAAANKGASRLASGATAAQSKMQNAMTQLLPQIDSIVSSLPPRGTTDQNIQRAVQFMTKMSQVTITK